MSQRVHPKISQKIEDLVKEGITDVQEVKRTLRFFVKTDMRENLPSENNRAYYPTNSDIQNHIDAAKTKKQCCVQRKCKNLLPPNKEQLLGVPSQQEIDETLDPGILTQLYLSTTNLM